MSTIILHKISKRNTMIGETGYDDQYTIGPLAPDWDLRDEWIDDGGKSYVLPDGYHVAESNMGTLEVYDVDDKYHDICLHPSGLPQLVGAKNLNECPVLRLAENK